MASSALACGCALLTDLGVVFMYKTRLKADNMSWVCFHFFLYASELQNEFLIELPTELSIELPLRLTVESTIDYSFGLTIELTMELTIE